MRRKVFEESLPKALAQADRVILGGVFRPQQLEDENRLDLDSVGEGVRRIGKDAHVFPNAERIADYLAGEVKEGDLLLVMSNGNFDGLCEKLLRRLAQPSGLPSEASVR
jgi:UDP-N-acetylmuramate: L-alanyl-gamma-D-glutamyl-meso-diaminopimelate ligase